MSLTERIKNSRKIADSSLKSYSSTLRALKKKMNLDPKLENTEFLRDSELLNIVDDKYKTLTTKKNVLTAILVALGSDDPKDEKLIKKVSDKLHKYNSEYMEFLKKQIKTDTQKKNWISYQDVIDIVNEIALEIKNLKLNKRKYLNKKEFDLLQQYVILRTYLDFPLRNDFADMEVETLKDFKKIPEEEKKDINYLVLSSNNVKHFHINAFKNRRRIGKKTMRVTKSVNKIINIWLKFNKSGYYLVRSDREFPMNPNDITKYFNKIFKARTNNKKISTSMLRHIIISYENRNLPTIKEKENEIKNIEDKFLHSQAINDLYRKID